MKYGVYKLHFTSAVHFGDGTLTDSGNRLMADTVFSALCIEALNVSSDMINCLVEWAENGRLIISDAMPFIGECLYIPKPASRVITEKEGDSVIKKSFKKLKYIPLDSVSDYFKGEFDPVKANEIFKKLGKAEMRTMAACRNKEETEPFFVGSYTFSENSGLYLIVGYENDNIMNTFEDLLNGVSLDGIGGKRSAGFGKFMVEKCPFEGEKLFISAETEHQYISLSLSMAKDNELKTALDDASYILVKRGGFISSETYAPENRRKRDFYAFQAGSCFKNKFSGAVFDVSGKGSHKVYKYAKPLFLEVKK